MYWQIDEFRTAPHGLFIFITFSKHFLMRKSVGFLRQHACRVFVEIANNSSWTDVHTGKNSYELQTIRPFWCHIAHSFLWRRRDIVIGAKNSVVWKFVRTHRFFLLLARSFFVGHFWTMWDVIMINYFALKNLFVLFMMSRNACHVYAKTAWFYFVKIDW